MSQTVIGLADALMVAHLGPTSLAATAMGALDSYLVLLLPMGTTFIVGSFASQLQGRGDLVGARRFGLYGLCFALVTALVGLGLIPLLEVLFETFSTESGHWWGVLDYEPQMRGLLTSYLGIRMLGVGPAVGLEALASYYGGLGRTRTPMIANVVLMCLNVALNYALIDGHFGAPALGVDGAAYASVIATTLAFLGLFAQFAREGGWPGFVWRELLRTLRFGLPSGLNWFLEFVAFAYFANVVVVGLGTIEIAALNAVLQINSASFMPAFGIASAGAILVGQAIGRGAKDEVAGLVRLTLLVAASWQAIALAFYLLAPSLLFSPFAPEPSTRAAMMEIGVRMLMLSAGWQLFDSVATVIAEALRAAGDTVWPLWIRILIAWLIFVPGSALTVTHDAPVPGDVIAVFWLVLYLALLALSLWLRYRTGAWRALELVEPAVDE